MNNKVNTSMDSTNPLNQQLGKGQTEAKAKPNDQGNFAVLGHVKIFDPNTKQVYAEIRE